jgi:hypothetical protein
VKRLTTFVVAALAAAAMTAAPAAPAGHDLAEAACWQGDSSFDSLTRLAGSANARAGKRDAEAMASATAEEVPASARGRGGKSFKTTIPVHLHIITAGSTGDLSRQQIDEGMTVLNLTFGGFEAGGHDTGFRFKLASVDRTDNADWFYNLDMNTTQERAAKSSLRKGGADALNVWTTYGPTYLGFATFPSSYKTHPQLDGIVLDYQSFPGGAYGTNYSLGETATHEVGHWLGLYHTFQGGCNNWGDYVDDTPAMLVPTNGCPAGKDTCVREAGIDPIHNYMDYSFDSCYTTFSPQQALRMQDHWLHFRAGGGFTVKG